MSIVNYTTLCPKKKYTTETNTSIFGTNITE